MKNILIIIFLFLSSIVFAKDDLDDALIEEITDGIGTLSFKLHTDIKANKVDVDGVTLKYEPIFIWKKGRNYLYNY